MRFSRKAFFKDFIFNVAPEVYEPAEDTFLLAENLSVRPTDVVLDVGTGCGILAILAAKKARDVIATDLNPHAVDCARINAKINKVTSRLNILLGDLFHPIRKSERFSLIIFNAPYLPCNQDKDATWMDMAWNGGTTGRRVLGRFVAEAPRHLNRDGRILLVQSSLSGIDQTLYKLSEAGLEARILGEKKTMFETVVLIEALR